MSRLKREGNPPSNQLASPVPQAWDPSINDFREITGQNLGGGRFGADGVQWGKTASGLFVPVRVTNDGVQEVQLSGNNVVKQEVVLERGIYSASTGRRILNKPPEARGLHLYCIVPGRTGTFASGEGIQLKCTFNRSGGPSVTSYGFTLQTERTSSAYVGHHLFIGPNFANLSNAQGEFARGNNCQMELTTNLNFEVSITGTFEVGQGFDIQVTAVWVR